MKLRTAILLIYASLLPLNALAQKAYTAVMYSGKAQNMNIRFTYADGYIGACKIKATDTKTKKIVVFLPESGTADNENKLNFYHYSAKEPEKKFTDHFILNGMEDQNELPRKIYGGYYLNGKVYPVVLVRTIK
jgi:hypothetical protein